MKEYRVSSAGQMTFPADVKHAWGLSNGGNLETVDLGSSVLMIPEGTSYSIIEQFYPESNLYNHGKNLMTNYEIKNPLRQSTPIEIFNSYKVSSVGQITLDAEARHRWNLDNGGTVNAENLQTALLLTPHSDSFINISSELPIDLFNSDWHYNRDGVLSRFLLEAYWDWINEEAEKIKNIVTLGGTIKGTQKDPTALGKIISEQIARNTLKLALESLS